MTTDFEYIESESISMANDVRILQNLSDLLDRIDMLNMYASLFLTALGLIGNVIALVVLVSARNKLPRLVGLNNLAFLTLVNTSFLLIQFYTYTYTRIIYHFNIDYDKTLQFFDSSQLVCKLLMYLRYTVRLLNAIFTVCFSVERLIAVYCPLRIRSLDQKCAKFFQLGVLVAVLAPSYSLYFIELVPSDASRQVHDRFNVTKAFSFNSIAPVISKHTCAAENFKLSLTLHCLMFLFILVSFLIVSFCITAIIIKLNKNNRFVFEYQSRSTEMNANGGEFDPVVHPSSVVDVRHHRRYRKGVRLIYNKKHDTKMLSSISVSFVLFNASYVASIFYLLAYTVNMTDIYGLSIEYLESKIKMQSLIITADTLQLVNFSITGLLFFFSGRIFRIHAVRFFRKLKIF